MNYYKVNKKDQQYYNCLYCLKKFNKNRLIIDNEKQTVTVKNDITWQLSKGLYFSLFNE